MAGSLDMFEADLVNGDLNNSNNGAEPDLFDENDDPFALPPPLPALDLYDGGLDVATTDQQDAGDNESKDTGRDRKTKKLVKRSPQPRLNEHKLCSEDKGIPALLHICDNIKFKGKGHEASDLKVLLQCYEHWAHRLFPKFPFENVVNQAEKLGHKKLVQNCIKRLRRGEEETVEDQGNDSDEEILNNSSQAAPTDTEAGMQQQDFGGQVQTDPSKVTMTPEVLEKIRQNRLKALEKRAAAQAAAQQKSSQHITQGEEYPSANVDLDDFDDTSFPEPSPELATMCGDAAGEQVNVERGEDHTANLLPSSGYDTVENELSSLEQTHKDQTIDGDQVSENVTEMLEAQVVELDQAEDTRQQLETLDQEEEITGGVLSVSNIDTRKEEDLSLRNELEVESQERQTGTIAVDVEMAGLESSKSVTDNCEEPDLRDDQQIDFLRQEQTVELDPEQGSGLRDGQEVVAPSTLEEGNNPGENGEGLQSVDDRSALNEDVDQSECDIEMAEVST